MHQPVILTILWKTRLERTDTHKNRILGRTQKIAKPGIYRLSITLAANEHNGTHEIPGCPQPLLFLPQSAPRGPPSPSPMCRSTSRTHAANIHEKNDVAGIRRKWTSRLSQDSRVVKVFEDKRKSSYDSMSKDIQKDKSR